MGSFGVAESKTTTTKTQKRSFSSKDEFDSHTIVETEERGNKGKR